MGAIIDSLSNLVGPVLTFLIVSHLVGEVLQTRYLKERITGVRDDMSEVQDRVKRLETQLMEADGGDIDE